MRSLLPYVPILLVQAIVLESSAQFAVEWSRSYGGSYSDNGVYVHQRPDDSYFIAGTTGLADGDFASASGDGQLLLMRTDPNGQMFWSHLIGGDTSSFQLFDGLATPDGNYVLVGRINIPDPGEEFYDSDADAFIMKVDPAGAIIWQRIYGGSGTGDFSKSVSLAANGDLVVMGNTGSIDGNIAPMTDGPAVWVVRSDPDGNEIWQTALGEDDWEVPANVQCTSDGGIAVFSSKYWSVDLEQTFVDMRLWKLNASGDLQWSRIYGDVAIENATHVQELSGGGFLLLGVAFGAWVARTDELGEIIWETPANSLPSGHFWGSIVEDDRYILYGRKQLYDPAQGYMDADPEDIWIVEMDTAGIVIRQYLFGGSEAEWPGRLAPANDGYILVGTSMSSDLLLSSNQGYGDLWIMKLTEKANLMEGTLYVDADGDAQPDTNEVRIANRFVELSGSGSISLSNDSGTYSFAAATLGPHAILPPSIENFTAAPSEHVTTFSAPNSVTTGLDFNFQPAGSVQDLQVFLTAITPFRPGFQAIYSVHCRNVGNVPVEATLQLEVDPLIAIDYVTIPVTSITGNSMQFDLGEMGLFDEKLFFVHVHLDPTVELGTLLITSAVLQPLNDDAVPADNSVILSNTITGSYDPNDITVIPTWIDIDELQDQWLDYTIRFQNTGTDTAFTVAIEHIIPMEVDLLSFDLLSASHTMEVMYLDFAQKLRFQFNNIQLPDSTTDEMMSHGSVRFRIRPQNSLTIGDVIEAQASIFFDFNAPVITNVAGTVIGTGVGMHGETSGTTFSIHPNPTTGDLTIQLNSDPANALYTITDLVGRNIATGRLTAKRTNIDLGSARGIHMLTIEDGELRSSCRIVVL